MTEDEGMTGMQEQEAKQVAVSIVVPCYNVEGYIEEALDSLCAQTLENIEILCVNDGSTDGTLGILERYAATDPRIVVIDKPNGGYGQAMNTGMARATGEYIGILESDDYVDPTMYESLYAKAKEYDLDAVKADFVKFWTREDGTVETKYEPIAHKPKYYDVVLDPSENTDLFNAQMLNWAGIYRTSFVREHGIEHNESPGASYQDNGFWFQVFCLAHRVMFLPQAFYHYRQDNAASSINQNNKVFCMLDEYAWIHDFLKAHPELNERFAPVYHYKKLHNLEFAFSLLAEQFQMPFLERMSAEYRAAREAGELDETLFWPDEWRRTCLIMDDPEAYRDEFNAGSDDADRTQGYAIARGKGRLAASAYILKEEGMGSLVRKAKRSIFHR